MPIIRLDPPKDQPTTFGRFVAETLGFITNPLASVINALTVGKEKRGELEILELPVEIDTDAQKVTVFFDRAEAALPLRKVDTRKGGNLPTPRNRAHRGAKAEKILQKVLDGTSTGAGIPWQFAQAVPVVQAIRQTYGLAERIPPAQAPELTTFRGLPALPEALRMAYMPPGGIAAFNQQTSANKIALTQGVRTGNGNKRRRAKSKRVKRKMTRRSGSRKLKFGSPAWRKKYMTKRARGGR